MKVINTRLRGRTGLFTIECVQGKFSAISLQEGLIHTADNE